jgi:hypothetical protein
MVRVMNMSVGGAGGAPIMAGAKPSSARCAASTSTVSATIARHGGCGASGTERKTGVDMR